LFNCKGKGHIEKVQIVNVGERGVKPQESRGKKPQLVILPLYVWGCRTGARWKKSKAQENDREKESDDGKDKISKNYSQL